MSEEELSRLNSLEELIASKVRIKILKVLKKEPCLQVTVLMRKVNCRYNELNRNLQLFKKIGIITDEYKMVKNQKNRIIHLMTEKRETRKLLKALLAVSDGNKFRGTTKTSIENGSRKEKSVLP